MYKYKKISNRLVLPMATVLATLTESCVSSRNCKHVYYLFSCVVCPHRPRGVSCFSHVSHMFPLLLCVYLCLSPLLQVTGAVGPACDYGLDLEDQKFVFER